MAIYTQPEDLLALMDFDNLAALCGVSAESIEDDDLMEIVRQQALHVAAEIETALAHRFANLPDQPAPFLLRARLTGTVSLIQWSAEVTGESAAFEDELAPGDGITDGLGNWAQVRELPEPPSSADAQTVLLEEQWSAADFEGAAFRGELHPSLRWISSYLTLESLFERRPGIRGRKDYEAKIGQARQLLGDIKNGIASLAGVTGMPLARSSQITADGKIVAFDTDLLYENMHNVLPE